MAIWVDADACPNVIKEILFRAAERVQMPLTLVANQNIRVPPSRFIRSLRVPAGSTWRIMKLFVCAARRIWSLPLIFHWRRKCWRKAQRRSTRAVNVIRLQPSGKNSLCVILWIPCGPAACRPEGRTACPSAIASSLLPNWINGCWK